MSILVQKKMVNRSIDKRSRIDEAVVEARIWIKFQILGSNLYLEFLPKRK